jgi:hypothetical protein
MNVEIGAEAAQFPKKEYINGFAVAVRAKFVLFFHVTGTDAVVTLLPWVEVQWSLQNLGTQTKGFKKNIGAGSGSGLGWAQLGLWNAWSGSRKAPQKRKKNIPFWRATVEGPTIK